jgi:kynurenine formamidase
MTRALPLVLLLAGCTGEGPDHAAVFDGRAGRWIDLTHAFSESTIYWPTDTAGFQLDTLASGPTPGGWFYASYAFSAAEHGGTHLDAPLHFAEGRLATDEIPLSGLIGPAAVVDVSERADPDYLVSVEDLTRWEGEHGELPNGGILLLRTGWGARWDDRTAYLGTSLTGRSGGRAALPGALRGGGRVARREPRHRRGRDRHPSIDRGQSADFRAHVILYAENVSGFENVANLDLLPATGTYVVALPMKIAGGSGGPLRIVAFVPSTGG